MRPWLLHQLRDEGRFAAGRGAQIQNRFAGLRAEFERREQRAGVLDVKPAVAETGERRQRRMRFQFEDQIFLKLVAPDRNRIPHFPHASDSMPALSRRAAVAALIRRFWAERVLPNFKVLTRAKVFGGVLFHSSSCAVFSSPKCFCQRVDQPFGMRPAERRLGGFQSGQQFSGLVGFAQIAAQDGVDKTGLRAKAVVLGEFDGFVDGGVVGNPVEPENLVKAEPQQILEGGFLFTPVGFAGDEPVERGLPADDAIDHFLAKPAVSGAKAVRRASARSSRSSVNSPPARRWRKTSRRNLSWILVVHRRLMESLCFRDARKTILL